jgi:hypothetical protein
LGITWAPFASGRTTLRSSWGIFHDWLNTGTYEQTLRVDGFRQQEIDLVNPLYPVVDLPAAPPVNRYLFGENVKLQRSTRVSLGIDQRLARLLQSTVTYAYTRGGNLARGLNLNAPADGVRPDPRFGNIVEVMSDANSRLHQLQVGVTANPGALLPIANAGKAPLVNFKRTTLFFNYTWATLRTNTDGAFSLSPLGDLGFEWGPGNGDVRHRVNVSVNNQIVRNLMLGINFNASSGTPYTIRTGRDDNGDLVFNDRPDGVGRNSARAAAHWSINTMLGYGFSFGRPIGGPPGIAVIAGGGGAPTVQSVDQGSRYRIQFFLQTLNLTNRANYIGYSGTQTSPFFGTPTAVSNTRRVETGINFSF